MANIIRWMGGKQGIKDAIVFSNPHNLDRASAKPGQGRDRKNLSLKLSFDEGRTWPINKTLEAGPSGYSDLAVLSETTLLCFYERSVVDEATKKRTSYLTIARVRRGWLTDREDR